MQTTRHVNVTASNNTQTLQSTQTIAPNSVVIDASTVQCVVITAECELSTIAVVDTIKVTKKSIEMRPSKLNGIYHKRHDCVQTIIQFFHAQTIYHDCIPKLQKYR